MGPAIPSSASRLHYDVSRADGGITMTARGVERGALFAVFRFGSLGLLVIAPPLLACTLPASGAVSIFMLLTAVAAMAGWVQIASHGIFERSPWSRVRRRLTIQGSAAVAADYRDAPQKPALVVDGVAFDPDDPMQVAVTSALRGWPAWAPPVYRVNLVLPSQVIRVETFPTAEGALALAAELRESLGLEGGEPPISFEPVFETTKQGVLLCLLIFAAHALPALGAVMWARTTDFAEGFATRLALASAAVALSALVVQGLALAFARSFVAETAQRTFGLDLERPPSRRRAGIGAIAWVLACIALAVLAQGSPSRARGSFRAGHDPLLVVEIDGRSAVLGWVDDGHGNVLAAFDAKTGARLWKRATPDMFSYLAPSDGRTAIAYGTTTEFEPSLHEETGVLAFDTTTGAQLWSRYFPGTVLDVVFLHGCFVILPSPFGGTRQRLDAATGTDCQPGDGFEERVAVMKAGARRDRDAKQASVSADGAVYDLDATGPALRLGASRGGQRIWQTTLPVQGVLGPTFAVSDGVVLVAGSEHHDDGRSALRLVAVDVATGRIRFVRKGDGGQYDLTADVVIAGAIGVVLWADVLTGYDLSTGLPAWSVGTRP